MAEATIYALLDQGGTARYVGQTRNLKKQLVNTWSGRLHPENVVNRGFAAWISSLRARPEALVLATVPFEDRYAAKAAWTTRLRAEGADLVNVVTGSSHAPETRAKIAEANRRRRERERAESEGARVSGGESA